MKKHLKISGIDRSGANFDLNAISSKSVEEIKHLARAVVNQFALEKYFVEISDIDGQGLLQSVWKFNHWNVPL